MMHRIGDEFLKGYARGPSASTVQNAVSLHTSIRDLLGDSAYATLLQGSYKNDTALSDMNDDRMRQYCHTLRIDGPSLRTPAE